MSETTRPKNFIENIIDADNEKGTYGGEVYTRFRRSRTDFSISAMPSQSA